MEKHASLLITAFLSGLLFSGFLVFLPDLLLPKTGTHFTCLAGDCMLQSGLRLVIPITLVGGLLSALLMIYLCRALCAVLISEK